VSRINLSLRELFSDLEPELLIKFCSKLGIRLPKFTRGQVTSDKLEHFLTDPKNDQTAAILIEELEKISDLSKEGMPFLVRACEKYKIKIEPQEKSGQFAMRVFLDESDAFDYAWSRFSIVNSNTKSTIHHINGLAGIKIYPQNLKAFETRVRQWFSKQAQGRQCIVKAFEDKDEITLLIRRGSYMKTVTLWEGPSLAIRSFRPAIEDILVCQPDKSELLIRSRLEKHRELYLKLFGSSIIQDSKFANKIGKSDIFSLAPLHNGSFDFEGSGPITKIELVKIRMTLYGSYHSIIELKASDVRNALENDLGKKLSSGDILLARFRFHLSCASEKPTTVTFEIEPPFKTDLKLNKRAQIIEDYLIKQKVKLH
jgi:hypothetical protein